MADRGTADIVSVGARIGYDGATPRRVAPMARLLVGLMLTVVTALNAAAPPLDPLTDVAARLGRDVGGRAALRGLVELAATDGDVASPDEPGLRVGNAFRAARLLRAALAAQPRA